MADPVNGLLAARMDPERRRRIGNALMAYQYDRPTPQDAPVTDRAGLFPLATYANGQTGIAWPGLIATPFEKMAQVLRGEITPGTPEFNEAGFDIAGAAMVGGLAAARPRGAVGSGFNYQLYHGSDAANIAILNESKRGPLGPGVYATPAKNVAQRYGETVHQLPAIERDIYRGSGTRTDQEFAGFKQDQERLVAAAEPDKRAAVQEIIDKTWTNDGYNAYWQLRGLYGGDKGAQDLFKRAGFDGISAIVDGPEVVLFGPQSLFANARPGAALGAGLSGASERQGIRAYHGSPHDFDRFDMSKIGTGEGAQAYGHGLYFAENEGVAKSYRDTTSGRNANVAVQTNGVRQLIGMLQNDPPKLEQALRATAAHMEATGTDTGRVAAKEAIAVADSIRDGTFNAGSGRMYEVNIKASPDDFLDWDKPLSQQSEKVRGVLNALGAAQATPGGVVPQANVFATGVARDGTAGAAVQALRDQYGRETPLGNFVPRVEDKLREAGIPGIKYLDQGSRSAGDGSRNYVVFDANLIEILRKYGLLGMLGAGGMAQELLKPSKPTIPDDAA